MEIGKLVRDKIPTIIKERGERPIYRKLPFNEIDFRLCLKLREELDELIYAKTDEERSEEVADLLEVIDSYLKHHKITKLNINKIRKEKLLKRGRFDNKVFLVSIEKPLTDKEKKERIENDNIVKILQNAKHDSSVLTIKLEKE